MAGAIAHEWIEPSGGAEKVLDAMVRAFPDVDVFALWDDAPERYPRTSVYESWIARTPLRRHKALALPFLLTTWRGLRPRRDYDWLLVSSHLFAHHARFGGAARDIPKFVYAHTPARYIWTPDLDERGSSVGVRVASSVIKPIDRRRAQEATAIAANSEFVRQRIQDAWGRDASVIYPPVDVELIQSVGDWAERVTGAEHDVLDALPEGFVLGASRFIPYKRLDLVILAAAEAGLPAVIAGRGPEEEHLRALADSVKVPVIFVISPSDEMLYALYQAASVFVFPPVEDFGIMPVEAMAAGARVVVNALGGAAESTRLAHSGVVFDDDSVEAVASQILAAQEGPGPQCARVAELFSANRFTREVREFVESKRAVVRG